MHSFNILTPGGTNIVKVTKNEIGLKEISISVNNPANNVKITIEKLDGQPASVTKTITGNVYQYIQITHENLNDTNINKAVIKFNVTKTWISQNGFDASEIALARFSNGEWQKLITRALRQNNNEIEYEADSPGLSTFAIVAEKSTAPPGATTTTIPTEEEATITTIVATTIPSAAGQTDFGFIGIIVFVIMVIFVLVYVVYMKMGKKKHHS